MCMKEVGRLFPELSEKRPVVGTASATAALSWVTSAASRAFSVALPAHRGFQASAAMETDRPAGRPTHFFVPVRAKRNLARYRILQHPFPPRTSASFSFQRLPALVNGRLRHDGFMPPNLIWPHPPACSGAGERCGLP